MSLFPRYGVAKTPCKRRYCTDICNLGIPSEKLTSLIFILVRACVHYALFEDEFYLKAQTDMLKETLEFCLQKYNPGAKPGVAGENGNETEENT